jgi:hypothetical protein
MQQKKRLSQLYLFPLLLLLGSMLACSRGGQQAVNGSDRERASQHGLHLSIIGKSYVPDTARLAIYQPIASPGGSTSVRNVDRENLEWKAQGYYQRNRDLGQVFTAEKDFWLDALVLCTGPTDKAVLSETPGARVFLQFYEVLGSPRINDNGTPAGTEALHGFTTNHRADDFIEGVTYAPLLRIGGGIFPDIPPTFDGEAAINGDAGRLVYMRWQLSGPPLKFEAGRRYAFMVGFEEAGRGYGFTLGNYNAARIDAPPSLDDTHDRYPGGWSLRREGDGTTPPTMIPGEGPPTAVADHQRLYRESLFPQGEGRYALAPTTDGYPDVDTYRDLTFALEVFWEKPEDSTTD